MLMAPFIIFEFASSKILSRRIKLQEMFAVSRDLLGYDGEPSSSILQSEGLLEASLHRMLVSWSTPLARNFFWKRPGVRKKRFRRKNVKLPLTTFFLLFCLP